MHEDYSREHEIGPGTDRSFGLTIAVALAAIAALPLFRHQPFRIGWLAAAVMLAVIALTRPFMLRPLNRLWFRLGLVLNRITSPVLLAAVFYLAVVPTGLMMRAAGKDPMRRRRNPQATTYWISRSTQRSSMTQQF
jgi:saxitoxin biosynthesis operon SxtJ-like protein